MRKIDFESELNAEQFAAVTSPPERPELVLAGAGSGKTRTLTYRVAWLISECGFSPREILLLTFTNKAARQMFERISELTGVPSSDFWGGTFHSVGNRFLRIEGAEIGIDPNFTIIDAEDSDKLVKRVVEDMYPRFFADKNNPRAKLLGDIISYARNTCSEISKAMMSRFSWIETPVEQIEKIALSYENLKRGNNYCDFDDLLELWKRLLEESSRVREKYCSRFKNILVDEYQDTNALQCKVLDMLACRGQISAVGDDAQCIYSWRGAEIDNILDFRSRYPAAHIYKIERNYRSTSQILNFANRVLDKMPSADSDYRKQLVGQRDGAGKPMLIRALDGNSQGRQIADCIREIVAGSNYGYSDIAVLYRSHYQAMDLQMQMQYKCVPFAITSGVKFFEQSHVKDLIAQIRFASNPRDSVSFLRFIKFIPKIGDKTARKIYETYLSKLSKCGGDIEEEISSLKEKEVLAKVPKISRALFEEMADCMAGLAKMVKRAGSSASQKILSGQSTPLRQVDFLEGELSAPEKKSGEIENSNFDENLFAPKDMVKFACASWYKDVMKSLYENWEDRCSDFDALYEYASRYSDFELFLANVSLEASETNIVPSGENAYSNEGRVRLMTVHQAKGLEFPVVFLIGAADGLFPIQRSLDAGEIEEERRLFYVAITRAKDHLIISYPSVSVVAGSFESREPSRFIEDIPPSLYTLNF